MTSEPAAPLVRPSWLVPVVVVVATLLVTTYGAVLDSISYAGFRERNGADEAVEADLAGEVTVAARHLTYLALVAAIALAARLAAAGHRLAAVAASVATPVVAFLFLLGATTLAWLALGLPVGGAAWPALLVASTARLLALGAAAAVLGLLLARLCGGLSAPFWVASAGVWLAASAVVLAHELTGLGEDPETFDSWQEWAPGSLALAVVRIRYDELSGGTYEGFGFAAGLGLLIGLNLVAVGIAGLLARLGGARR